MQKQTKIPALVQPLLASVICTMFLMSWWSLVSVISSVYAAKHRASHVNDSCMFLSWGWHREIVSSSVVLYSSFFWSFLWKHTGKIESTASIPSTAREFQDTASPAVVSLYRVVPAFMATKDGGATPKNVPIKNTPKGTLMTGDVILINQLGRKGVILKKMM